jgi:hypothetical protein
MLQENLLHRDTMMQRLRDLGGKCFCGGDLRGGWSMSACGYPMS